MTDTKPWDGRPENPEQDGWHRLARAFRNQTEARRMSKYELETIEPGEARYYAVSPRKIAPLVSLLRKKTVTAYVVTKHGEGCIVTREGKKDD